MNIKESFSIILQQNGRPPKYFEFNRQKTKLIFILFPLMGLIFCFGTTALILYFSTIKTSFLMERPKLEQLFKSKEIDYQKTIENLESKNLKLSQDLIFKDDLPFTSNQLIRVLPGAKDKINEQMLEVDSKKIIAANNQFKVSFNITNQSIVEKVAGYFFTFLKINEVIQIYPKKSIKYNELTFRDGEYFSTSRFRPVEVPFKKFDTPANAELIIIIFSRTGDLIYSKSEQIEITNE